MEGEGVEERESSTRLSQALQLQGGHSVTGEAVVLTDGFAAALHSPQGESRGVTSEAGAHART